MGIKVRRNFKFSDIDLSPGVSAMRETGDVLVSKVVRRTQSGLDEDNQPFTPLAYSEHADSGADLQASGKMLADFGVVEASRNRVALGFKTERSARIADLHQSGTDRMPARPFLGVPTEWVMSALRRAFRRSR